MELSIHLSANAVHKNRAVDRIAFILIDKQSWAIQTTDIRVVANDKVQQPKRKKEPIGH
jgi:hypothetical protein